MWNMFNAASVKMLKDSYIFQANKASATKLFYIFGLIQGVAGAVSGVFGGWVLEVIGA